MLAYPVVSTHHDALIRWRSWLLLTDIAGVVTANEVLCLIWLQVYTVRGWPVTCWIQTMQIESLPCPRPAMDPDPASQSAAQQRSEGRLIGS